MVKQVGRLLDTSLTLDCRSASSATLATNANPSAVSCARRSREGLHGKGAASTRRPRAATVLALIPALPFQVRSDRPSI